MIPATLREWAREAPPLGPVGADEEATTGRRTIPFRRGLFFALVAFGLLPVWGFKYFPTQDGPSHMLNARVFEQCVDPSKPEAQFFERRLSPIPNWTAAALLWVLNTVAPPFVAEKVVVSIYLVGLPLAVDYFLAAIDASGASILALLFVWNTCLLRGFYSYCLGIVLLFLILGWFLRRAGGLSFGETTALSVLLLASYFTHLAALLLTVFCLVWVAVTGPGARLRRVMAIAAAAAPALVLTWRYFVSTGFFGTPEVSSALDIAREEVRGTMGRLEEAPALLYHELFAVHGGVWAIGLAMVAVCMWAWDRADESDRGSKRLAWPMFTLFATLLLLFALIPDTLRAHGGYLKGRIAPVALLLSLGAIRSARRSPLGVRHLGALVLIAVNFGLVVQHVARMDREIEEFTSGTEWVHAGETLVSVKPEPESTVAVDPFFSEYYCLDTQAVCLSSYEGGTEHFPVKLKSGMKHRIRQNKAGSFWADVVLGWDAADDALPQAGEPYSEVYRRGRLRLFRRISLEPTAPLKR